VTLVVAQHPSAAFHRCRAARCTIGSAQQPKDHCAGTHRAGTTAHDEILLPLPLGGNCRLFR
jgi:hypothetical protein